LKVVLSLRHRRLPASVNFRQLNPKIRLKDTPFAIQDRLRDWDAEQPRLAAVSSFGSGGANAHVVVQEYAADVPGSCPEEDHLFVLSATSEDRLRVYVSRVIVWLEGEATGTNFGDAIFTWQVGRTAMKQRLAIKVKDHLDLLGRLKQWIAGSGDATDVWFGQMVRRDPSLTRVWQTKSGRQLIDEALSERDLELLGTAWAAGTDIDWRRCYDRAGSGQRTPRIISLPTYPFARDRHWIDSATSRQVAIGGRVPTGAVTAAVIHPLLHTNTSDLDHQSYSATFTGDEFFLSDHQVRADGRTVQKVLPGVAYLEMARAAIEQAVPAWPESTMLELRNTVWVQPIVVTGKKQVGILLSTNGNEEIDYEIYSQDTEDRRVHCQGRAVFSRQEAPAGLDLEQLKRETLEGQLEPSRVYAARARMGLVYGPAFRSITAIRRGSRQLLAHLRLMSSIRV
jgi:acyl transferase domain-containing protein